ncbi:hypothetical protein ScPMuIL_008753 [Solemya velum]
MASKNNWEEARNYLRKMREEQMRDGEYVVRLWEEYLEDNSHKLGDELWTVYEQVCIAALDCRRMDVAEICFEALSAKFPGSVRVRRLQGMKYEAEERYEYARREYDDILEEDNANMFVRKRKVAMLKSQNKIAEAIEELYQYTKKFMTDFEAWMELCDLYLVEQDYTKAVFCMEELIMSNPHNHLYHQKYAEIKYTQGGAENMELARSYFAQAVKLNPNNMRALYGMFLSSSHLAHNLSKGQKDKQTNTKYAAWAAQQITEKYETSQKQEQTSETKYGRV